MPSRCPYCNRLPQVEKCEPWSKEDGPQPWYAGCYSTAPREHFVGGNGTSALDAVKTWEREVAKHAASPVR